MVAAISLSLAPNGGAQVDPEPTVNLSAVRMIICDEGQGSGFLINDNVIATAAHVSNGTNCYDKETLMPLKEATVDKEHDFALMTGNLPDMPPIKYSCEGYKAGKVDAYGYSDFNRANMLFRQVTLTVGGKEDVHLDTGEILKGPRRLSDGYIVFGMSGGPHIQNGYAVGLTNSGNYLESIFGVRYMLPKSSGFELKDTVLCKR